MAEIVLSGINAKDQVLVTDTELALPVYSRLITCDHSRNQSLTIEVLTDVLRPLVDIQIESDPVAGSVAEIALCAPERFAGQDIQLATSRPLRENSLCQCYMPFQDQSIVLFLQLGTRPKRNSSGDVSSTEQVLPAGIAQVKSFRIELSGAFLRCDIVRQSGVRTVSRNRLETLPTEALDLTTELVQFP